MSNRQDSDGSSSHDPSLDEQRGDDGDESQDRDEDNIGVEADGPTLRGEGNWSRVPIESIYEGVPENLMRTLLASRMISLTEGLSTVQRQNDDRDQDSSAVRTVFRLQDLLSLDSSNSGGLENVHGTVDTQRNEDTNDTDHSSAIDTFIEFTGSQDRDRALRYILAADGQLDAAINMFLSGMPLEVLTAALQSDVPPQRTSRSWRRGLPRNLFASVTNESRNVFLELSGCDRRRAGLRSQNSTFTTDDLEAIFRELATAEISGQSASKSAILDKTSDIGVFMVRNPSCAESYIESGLCRLVVESIPIVLALEGEKVILRFLQLLELTILIILDGYGPAMEKCRLWCLPPRRPGLRRSFRSDCIDVFLEKVVPSQDVSLLLDMWRNETFDPCWRDKKSEAEMLACALSKGCSTDMLAVLVNFVYGCRANVNPEPDRLGNLPPPLVLAATGAGFDHFWKNSRSLAVDSAKTVEQIQQEADVIDTENIETSDEESEKRREEYTMVAVDILLDAGAEIDETVLSHIDTMTMSARQQIEKEQSGTRCSSNPASDSIDWLTPRDDLLALWWKNDSQAVIRALLGVVHKSKHKAARSRGLEILALIARRLPSGMCRKVIKKLEYANLMQLVCASFSSSSKQETAATSLLYVDIICSVLQSTLHSDTDTELSSEDLKVDALFHQKMCLDLCRLGIVRRLCPSGKDFEDETEKSILSRKFQELREMIHHCVIDVLQMPERSLFGMSTALSDVCFSLSNGDGKALKQLAALLSPASPDRLSDAVFGEDDDNDNAASFSIENKAKSLSRNESQQFGQELGLQAHSMSFQSSSNLSLNDGVTMFEFEESKLANALLHFLEAKDALRLTDDAKELRKIQESRMQALLSAMPPIVVGEDDEGELDDDDDGHESSERSSAVTDNIVEDTGGDNAEEIADWNATDEPSTEVATTSESQELTRQNSTALEEAGIAAHTKRSTETKDFTSSALHRLVAKLQATLSAHALESFPIVSHQSPIGCSGVRALTYSIQIDLQRDHEFDRCTKTFPHAEEMSVHLFPLTPLYELQRQVLRSVRISDPDYVKFCRKLVGTTIIHWVKRSDNETLQNSSTPLNLNSSAEPLRRAIVLQYDAFTGSHLLLDLSEQNSFTAESFYDRDAYSVILDLCRMNANDMKWCILSARDFEIIGRAFEGEFVSDKVLSPGALYDQSSGLSTYVSNEFLNGAIVAVWWRGSDELSPCWRRARITRSEKSFVDVEYIGKSDIAGENFDLGDRVQVTRDAVELEQVCREAGCWYPEMAIFAGHSACIKLIDGDCILTDGLGGFTYGRGALLAADDDANIVRHENCEVAPVPNEEKHVPRRRLCSLDVAKIGALNHLPIFSVLLVPDGAEFAKVRKKKSSKSKNLDANGATKFKLYDRIEARFGGRSRYYKGRISRVNVDNTYDIAYDDGDSERSVSASLICPVGRGTGSVFSYDFRRIFPNSAGRALFESLRRADSVLETEYNFVTRGFAHQPDFYATFCKTLEDEGEAVFARFQTYQQAKILFDRVQHFAQNNFKQPFTNRSCLGLTLPSYLRSDRNSVRDVDATISTLSRGSTKVVRVYVDIFPDCYIPPVVERDILSAFENAYRSNKLKKPDTLPFVSPSGGRVQISVKPEDFLCPEPLVDRGILRDQSSDQPVREKWRSATIIARRLKTVLPEENVNTGGKENSKPSRERLCCVLDNGTIVWDLPLSRARKARRTLKSFPHSLKQSKGLNERSGIVNGGNENETEDEANSDGEAVELVRQFSAFGKSSAYKRISIESVKETTDMILGSSSVGFGHGEHQPALWQNHGMIRPRLEVDFVLNDEFDGNIIDSASSEYSTGSFHASTAPVLAHSHGDVSVFHHLFKLRNQSISSPGAKRSGENSNVSASWISKYSLSWRVRCVFQDGLNKEPMNGFLKGALPWKTPDLLLHAFVSCSLSLREFCQKMVPIAPDFVTWASRHRLKDVLDTLDETITDVRTISNASIASICAAYSELCYMPVSTETGIYWAGSHSVQPRPRPLISVEDCGNSVTQTVSPSIDSFPGDRAHAFSLNTFKYAPGLDIVTVLEECGIGDNRAALRDTLILLRRLHAELVPLDEKADPLTAAFGKSLPWRNESLSDLLTKQLKDSLAIATSCYPRWVSAFPREFSFLISAKVRQAHFRSTSLGVSRAVSWLQDELSGLKAKKKHLAHVTLEISAMFRGVPDMSRYERLQAASDRLEDEIKAIEHDHCIGKLQQDLVKVNRATLLNDSERLMAQHMKERSELVVQFLDETGAGEGVTLDFYSSVSERLQLIKENSRIPIWVSSKPSVGTKGGVFPENGEVKLGNDHDVVSANQNDQRLDETNFHIVSNGGLFPQPLFPLGMAGNSESNPYLSPNSFADSNFQDLQRQTISHYSPQCAEYEERVEWKVEKIYDNPLLASPESKVNDECGKVIDDDQKLGLNDGRTSNTKGIHAAELRNQAVVKRFRFLGRVMAKALLDGMNLPLPLSPEFFMLLQNRRRLDSNTRLLPMSALSLIENSSEPENALDISLEQGKSLGGSGMIQQLYDLHERKELDKLEELLDDLDLRFVDPFQPPLLDVADKDLSVSEIVRDDRDTDYSKDIDEAALKSLKVPPFSSKSPLLDDLIKFAKLASTLGATATDIENRLLKEGHTKLSCWKAIKASQKQRVLRTAERAEKALAVRRESLSFIASELIPGGRNRVVTVDNIGEYLNLILQWWLGDGIVRQADAYSAGIADVLGPTGRDELLCNFSHLELRRLLCGKEEIVWNEEDPLLGCIVPMGDYSAESPTIKMLCTVLRSMKMHERAQFLNFVTARPRVPLSGLPAIKVYPPIMECVSGITLKSQPGSVNKFSVGDIVALAEDYYPFGDTMNRSLKRNETGVVSSVRNEVKVKDWWYHPDSLRLVEAGPGKKLEEQESKRTWFRKGDMVKIGNITSAVAAWDHSILKLTFSVPFDISVRRTLKPGQKVSVIERHVEEEVSSEEIARDAVDNTDAENSKIPNLYVDQVCEQPQAVQMHPYLRPKATTCANTLYLPPYYDSAEHMMDCFMGAFSDAKLGGMYETTF